MNVKVQWDQYQDDEHGSQWYQATVEFSAEHLGPGKTATRHYEDHYPTKISNQIAEDIRLYLEDPIEFVKELLRSKGDAEMWILELKYQIAQTERTIKHAESNIAIWRKSMQDKLDDIIKIEKQMKGNK